MIIKLKNKLQIKQDENEDITANAYLELYEEKVDENNMMSKENKKLQIENFSVQTLLKEQSS